MIYGLMYKQRIVTSLVLLPLLILILGWGGELVYSFLIFCVSLVCLLEFLKMSAKDHRLLLAISLIAGLLPVVLAGFFKSQDVVLMGLFLQVVILSIVVLLFYSSLEKPFETLASLSFGLFYISLCSSCLLLLRFCPTVRHGFFSF